jgi:anaerobic magnesium-protoporphyrin IX monomethyl ester cyclase
VKVLLVTASFEDEQRSPEIQDNSHYPIGLGYLHAFIESKGHHVTTLFLNDYPSEQCTRIVIGNLEDLKPDVVGFQILTGNRVVSFRLIEHVLRTYPDVKIVIGGIHATIMHEQILTRYPSITAILGEGEITLSELLDSGKAKEDIDGIAFNNNGKIVKTNDRALFENLDELPFPKHEAFFNEIRRSGCVLTSRGCPFACSFCCLCSISQRRVRYRSVKNVVDEIEYMAKQFREMDSVWIHDDSFMLNNQRVIEFCEEVISRGIRKKFICSGRMKPVSRPMIQAMERAGFQNVLFGLESGAEEILRTSKKGITKKDAIDAFTLFSNSSIRTTAFLIVGLPGETPETVIETIELVQNLQKIKYTFFGDIGVLFIYPGTEVYEIAKAKGFIDDDYWLTDRNTPLYAVDHSIETLNGYKETILNHIALDRIFTPAGYAAQKRMLPHILKDHTARMRLVNLLLSRIVTKRTTRGVKEAMGLDRKTRKARMAAIKKIFGLH